MTRPRPASFRANDPFNALCHVAPAPPPAHAIAASRRAPLQGWDIAVKDNFCTHDMPTSCASTMLADYRPHFDATAVSRLRSSGASIIGKTNCDEFGMGSASIHSKYGPVINPAAPSSHPRVAGGSSGGSAAAVADGLCRAALASDTGGSTRLPAAYCGVWGLKPSYGLISRWGLVSYADSLDTVGIIASNCEDTRTVFETLSVLDPRDPTCVSDETRQKASRITQEALSQLCGSARDGSLRGLRVGVPREYFPSELHPRVLPALRRALERLRDRGATLVSVSLPSTPYALSAYYVIASAEASSNLARYDGVRFGHRSSDVSLSEGEHPYTATRSEGFGAEVQRRILLGTYALTAGAFDNYFLQAQRVRKLIQRDFQRVLRIPSALSLPRSREPANAEAEGVDVLLHPSAVDIAPRLPSYSSPSAEMHEAEPTSTFDSSAYVQDVLTVPSSLAGLPALNVPMGRASTAEGEGRDSEKEARGDREEDETGWPVGVSIVGQWGTERVLFECADAIAGR